MKVITIFILLIFFISCNESTPEITDIDSNFFINNEYNIYEIPPHKSDDETEYESIDVFFNPVTISSISPKNMEFSLDLFLGSMWLEPRLNYTFLTKLTPENYFKYPKRLISKMWLPSLYFENCKGCTDIMVFDSDNVYAYYDKVQNKSIVWIRRLVAFICHFNLRYYPFDTQTCSVKIQTYGPEYKSYKFGFWSTYSENEVNVPTEFRLIETTANECANTISPINSKCFMFNFVLRRSWERYIWTTFVPSTLIVIISFMSFWVDPDMVAPRVTLGLTSMLTLVTLSTSAIRDLPPEPTIMAIDIWLSACIILVFTSIMEFTIVIYIYYHTNSNLVNRIERADTFIKKILKAFYQKSTAKMLDRICQILFPIIFFLTFLTYWIYYITEFF